MRPWLRARSRSDGRGVRAGQPDGTPRGPTLGPPTSSLSSTGPWSAQGADRGRGPRLNVQCASTGGPGKRVRLHPSTRGRRYVESCEPRTNPVSHGLAARGEAARTPCRGSLGGAARHEREAPRCRTRVIGLDAEGRQAWDRRVLGEQRVCPRPDSLPLSMRRRPSQVRPRVALISRADDLSAEDTTATNANDMQTRGDACACAAHERAHDASRGTRARARESGGLGLAAHARGWAQEHAA